MGNKVFLIWLLATFLFAFTLAQNRTEEEKVEIEHELPLPPPGCCYGDEEYYSGDLVRSFPKKCFSLYCKWGKIYPVYHHRDECNCCEYNGKMYKSGEKIPGICIDLICREGQWETNYHYNQKCGMCHLQDDVHFNSFDGVAFDFHGTCNYSITQKDFSYASPWGVYGDFRPCLGSRSCLDITTFVDDSNTVIEMDYPQTNQITVNGIPYTVSGTIQPVMAGATPTPVLGWSHGDCISLLGTQGYYLQYCWFSSATYRKLSIWAAPNLANNINGLCGHFDYTTFDELLWRNGVTVTPNPPTASWQLNAFGNSWLTNEQSDTTCPVPARRKRVADEEMVAVDCEQHIFESKKSDCLDLIGSTLQGQAADDQAEFCAGDLCALEQIGASPTDIKEYIGFFLDAVKNERVIKDHTGLTDEGGDGNGGDDNGDGDGSVSIKGGKIKIRSKSESILEVELN